MRSISLKLLLPVASFLLLSHCKKEEGLNPNVAGEFKNIPYGSHAQQVMDIYVPAGRTTTTTKVAVLVHGGGWNGGDKSDFTQYVDSIKRREPTYAIFNINYRTVSNNTNLFPAQEQDVKAAMEFIAANLGKYSLSNKVVLFGGSSGGHLALLQAYKQVTPIAVKAVIDFFGPTDLVWMYNNPPNQYVPVLLEQVTGGTPTSHAAIYQSSSPINFVTSQSPPTLIFQGGQDPLVSPNLSTMLRDKLQTNGVANQYVFYPNEAHGWVGATMKDSFDKIAAFLATHVQ